MAAHYLTARDVYIGDRPVAEPPAPSVELPPLPQVAPGFTGRTRELDELLVVLGSREGAGKDEEESDAATSVVVSAVQGMGGIGKTALAVSAGRRALEAGAFTGTLFLDLRGYDDVPIDAARALDDVLRQLGVDAAQIPLNRISVPLFTALSSPSVPVAASGSWSLRTTPPPVSRLKA